MFTILMMFQRHSQSTSTFACTINALSVRVSACNFIIQGICFTIICWLNACGAVNGCVCICMCMSAFFLSSKAEKLSIDSARNKHSDTFICFLMHSYANLQSFFTCLCLFFLFRLCQFSYAVDEIIHYSTHITPIYFIHIVHCLFDS